MDSSNYQCVAADVKIGKDVKLSKFINLYGCTIGDETKIGAFVEIQRNAHVGKRCKISSHSFVCEGVTIEDFCFIGHGVMFINDRYPRSVTQDGRLEVDSDWKDRFCATRISKHVSIGTNATLLGGITVGEGAVIGAGSVVTKDIPPFEIWAGNPARFIRRALPKSDLESTTCSN